MPPRKWAWNGIDEPVALQISRAKCTIVQESRSPRMKTQLAFAVASNLPHTSDERPFQQRTLAELEAGIFGAEVHARSEMMEASEAGTRWSRTKLRQGSGAAEKT
eukprot:CAMPEP_0183450670 /NCGR_PEP_ID=MMETSP0370-20130417/113164_1 /TAXON_ID=268820 /ORGANISM="Peridinium aciculiferum, Strain PAER-2" /LENGTH=104 /DNA_ID=CAMNT_0025641831 /DNA_START=249 /DNA_END=561 /DNA_ORIENTATION=+